jgi:UDP-N-acetylglucosamine--N-acetylmuramyl-(pentapeptide) pyrophosphoryl-undecaprenol N-acetylglucosamine transferase
MKKQKIIIVGGGTGGHLFPAIALAEKLSAESYDVHLITDSKCKKYLSKHYPFSIEFIDSAGLNSGILSKIFSVIKVVKAIVDSLLFFVKTKPDLVIAFGGYVSFAPLFVANMLFVPNMIHEQNAVMGKVNRWFARFTKRIFLSYPTTLKFSSFRKALYTGNPIRSEILSTKIRNNFKSNPFNIVVMGGSQGASIFSKIIPEIIANLPLELRKNINITQQSKKEDIERLEQIYRFSGVSAEVSSFFYNINQYLENAHLVITRAGASSITELTYLQRPAVLIPFRFAAENHQYYNAKYLSDQNAAWLVEESKEMIFDLKKILLNAIEDRALLEHRYNMLKNFKNDSCAIMHHEIKKFFKFK